MPAVAIVPVDLRHSRLGTPSRAAERFAGDTVLGHTLRRVASVPSVASVVVLHPQGQDPRPLIPPGLPKPVTLFADGDGLCDADTQKVRVARLWAPTTWRGGLGGATTFDELLPAGALLRAMEAHDAASALIVGGDWCVVDPVLCEAVLAQHLAAPDGMKLTFTQAPPGLCGVATNRAVLRDLAENRATFGHVFGYNPRAPIPDPIGKEANLPIPAGVRDSRHRYVFDTPRSASLLRAVADELGAGFADADASDLTLAAERCTESEGRLPQQVTLELTPRRPANGPITPHHYASFDREDLDVDLASRIVTQLAEAGDVALLLGGLGDALEHPRWDEIVTAARDVGVASIGLETDLLCDEATVGRVLELPVDLVSVRLNADTAATYRRVMGIDGFATVIHNLELLINTRNRRAAGGGVAGLPWILPRMVKTRETLPELELFYDKWSVYTGHPVIEPARCGCGVMPELSPVPMAPPARKPCRQVARRMTILSDGRVAQCDQDWHGAAALGDARLHTLEYIWRRGGEVAELHRAGRFAELTLCGACPEWHRP